MSKDPHGDLKTISEWLVEYSLLLFLNNFKLTSTQAIEVQADRACRLASERHLSSENTDKSHLDPASLQTLESCFFFFKCIY